MLMLFSAFTFRFFFFFLIDTTLLRFDAVSPFCEFYWSSNCHRSLSDWSKSRRAFRQSGSNLYVGSAGKKHVKPEISPI